MPENVPVDRPNEEVLHSDSLKANVQLRPDKFFAQDNPTAFEPPETYKTVNPEAVIAPDETLPGSKWK
jgi:hypothetical protein